MKPSITCFLTTDGHGWTRTDTDFFIVRSFTMSARSTESTLPYVGLAVC